MKYEFKAKLWRYRPENPEDSIGLWIFVSVPKKYYDEIKLIADGAKKGFGSVKVEAKIGTTTFKTSIFPDTKSGSYLLPVKKAVRSKENIDDGDEITIELTLLA